MKTLILALMMVSGLAFADAQIVDMGILSFKSAESHTKIIPINAVSANKIHVKFRQQYRTRTCQKQALTISNGTLGSLGCLYYNYENKEAKRKVKINIKEAGAKKGYGDQMLKLTITRNAKYGRRLTFKLEVMSGSQDEVIGKQGLAGYKFKLKSDGDSIVQDNTKEELGVDSYAQVSETTEIINQ